MHSQAFLRSPVMTGSLRPSTTYPHAYVSTVPRFLIRSSRSHHSHGPTFPKGPSYGHCTLPIVPWSGLTTLVQPRRLRQSRPHPLLLHPMNGLSITTFWVGFTYSRIAPHLLGFVSRHRYVYSLRNRSILPHGLMNSSEPFRAVPNRRRYIRLLHVLPDSTRHEVLALRAKLACCGLIAMMRL